MMRAVRLLRDNRRSSQLAALVLLSALPACAKSLPESVSNPAPPSRGDAEPPESKFIKEPLVIAITGREYQWYIRYPGPDGEPDTKDDVRSVRNVHVPLDTDIVLILKSDDYIYRLAVPEYDLKEIAVPDLEFSLRFHPPNVGEFELRGDQMCGYSHPQLLGHLIVQTQAQFAAWMSEQNVEE